MTTTLDLPDNLVQEIERRAARDGRELSSVYAQLLRMGLAVPELAPRPRSDRIKTDPVTGSPYIECPPGAPIESMTTEEILAMEYDSQLEEDLERYGLPVRHEPVGGADVPQPPAPSRGQ